MPMYRGQAIAGLSYVVLADDEEEAMGFILDNIKEDYEDAEFYEVSKVKEVE